VPQAEWDKGPAAANAWIAARLAQLAAQAGPPGTQERTDTPAQSREQWDFFISYTGSDLAYAKFVDQVIRDAGKSVFVQFRNMPVGSNFVNEMNNGLEHSNRFVALLSADYWNSPQCQAEWTWAYNYDPSGKKRFMIPLKIRECDLKPLAKQIVYQSLIDRSQDEATKAILQAAGLENAPSKSDILWPPSARHELARQASPAPALSSDGKLDVGRNPIVDQPEFDPQLVNLPSEQIATIETLIRIGLRNMPQWVGGTLRDYADELRAFGVQPRLGVLRNLAEIVLAEVADVNSEGRLTGGERKAYDLFKSGHETLMKHFPLDASREKIYASVPVDEEGIRSDRFRAPFASVRAKSEQAKTAGLASGNFATVTKKFDEYASVVASMPPAPENNTGTDEPTKISPGKRVLLTGFGFIESTSKLLAENPGMLETADGKALAEAMRNAADGLAKLINL
jgi:hypothetical protein